MKTEQLVKALVADRAAGRKPISAGLALALALGGAVSLVIFLVDLGVRADIEPALATWRFDPHNGEEPTTYYLHDCKSVR